MNENNSEKESFELSDNRKPTVEVSVLILTYEPDLQKLKTTIASALLQENVSLQIVISDDGSKNFPQKDLVLFFQNNSFDNYIISRSEKNRGTVFNVKKGLEKCTGEYLKIISPGDCINGTNTLYEWISLMEVEKADLSFTDIINYSNDSEYKTYRLKTHPQVNNGFFYNSWYYNYLIFGDIAVGASSLTTVKLAKKYINLIVGKVIYAEDNIYRIMAADHVSMFYFNKNGILYEYGTGISTSNSNKWGQRLSDDWTETDKIILSTMNDDSLLNRNFKRIVYYRYKTDIFSKIKKYLTVRGLLRNKIRSIFHPRYSSTELDMEYMKKLSVIANK